MEQNAGAVMAKSQQPSFPTAPSYKSPYAMTDPSSITPHITPNAGIILYFILFYFYNKHCIK